MNLCDKCARDWDELENVGMTGGEASCWTFVANLVLCEDCLWHFEETIAKRSDASPWVPEIKACVRAIANGSGE